jgi:hypothetical protein
MRDDNKIHVINAFLKKEAKFYELNKFQLWICKLFKIEPACKFMQTFEILLPLPYFEYGGSIGDIMIFSTDAEQWYVSDILSRRVSIFNMTPLETRLTENHFRGIEAFILSRTFKEKSVR